MPSAHHTQITLQQRATGFATYPIKVRWFRDGLFVVETSREHRDILRARLIKIGNTEIDDAYARVSSLTSHGNEPSLRESSPTYLVVPEVLQALGILCDTQNAPFLVELQDGSTMRVEMAPVKRGEHIDWESALEFKGDRVPLYLRNSGSHYWFTYLKESETLYLRYTTCMNMKQQSFSDFCRQICAFIDSNPAKRLVIDLRGNSGGSSHLLELFISELVNRPELNKRGHLFGIVDRGTFSSGVLNAVQLRKHTEAILFGEPTGGKPKSYGDARDFFLPNSDLMVSYSTKYLDTVEEDTDSVNPDVIVELSSSDYFAGRDPVLQAILSNPQTYL